MRLTTFTTVLYLLAAGTLAAQGAGKTVLFNHTHHEEGGVSAEWVICSTSEPNPSPANPASETAWNGALSALGFDLHNQGYTVQTLPASGGRISYGDTTNAMDLSHYTVFFIPECYTLFSSTEKQAIVSYVQNGGGLFLLGNHVGASRVSSTVPGSTDAYTAFNDLLTNNGIANNGFGFTFVPGHGPGDAAANTTSTAYSTANNAAATAIIHGANGTLAMQDFHSFSYLKTNTANNPSAQGILATQVSGDPTTDYFIATATFGNGRVVATSDSSPVDDGTSTTSGKNLHNSYTLNSNRAFFLNAIQYLAASSSAKPPVVSITAPASNVSTTPYTTLTFQGAATDPQGNALTYGWAFGDATTATGLGPVSHAYVNAGTYTVTFTATDAQGLSSSAQRTIAVAPATGNTVTATLTAPAGNVTVASGASVAFTGSGQDSSTQATLSYGYAFGDGATATGAFASHVYTNAGTAAVARTAVFTVTDNTGAAGTASRVITVNPAATSTFREPFESGVKTSYSTGAVAFPSGSWTLNDALVGTSSSDAKNGAQGIRIRNSGKLTMGFNLATGAKRVSVAHGLFGGDTSATWSLWYSTNSGSSWTQAGSAITTTSRSLATATFTLNVTGAVRFELRKTDGSSNRLNVDDFTVTGN